MLKGPDPHMALALIDRLGLYDTIFTDPTKEISYKPDIFCIKPAYDCVFELLRSTSDQETLSVISSILLRNFDEKYLAWIAAALVPWADAPLSNPPKKGGKTTYTAQLVAREGIKAPNKISDVITSSVEHSENIRALKDRCVTQLKYPHRRQEGEDATARDTLGMAIRRWGQTWRSQVLFSLLYEVSLGLIPKDSEYLTLNVFHSFLTYLIT
jgi:tRNA nucleotidyltransferase (CCA-adding enzyme)